MQLRAAFIADPQATELMQPGERAFHDPAIDSQAAAMRCVAFGQHGFNPQTPQPTAMGFRVVATITLHAARAAARAATFAAHGRDGFDQRLKFGDVIRVCAGQAGRQRKAVGICDYMVLAARLGFIRGIRPGFGPPFSARSGELSTTARDQSIWSAAWSLANKTSCSRCQTPAACQSRRRRQQVMPLPQPISWGKSSQPMPVFKTNMMPVSACRLSIGLRPGYRNRRGFAAGRSGSMIAHNSSSMRGFAIRKALPISSAVKSSGMLPQLGSFC